ncbi:MAG: polyribonucleotide nucleotidyltransferase, partial [Patescibacteria group bacterium]|nr:polyribonucleotide nucleotidyltransferase [Patescibacteria group bacterium]
MKIAEESIIINEQKLTLQTGKLAQAATTSVFGRLGDTCVLVTITTGEEREDIDYLPLQVEYVEKLYAGGKIKGSRWVKREGRPSDEAILKARLIDRSIRPLFPKNYHREIQIIITLLSVDGVNSPEILAAITTSAALHLSPIPWQGPVATLRLGYIQDNGKGTFLINPTEDEQTYSVLDLIVSSTKEKVVMIEAKAEEIEETVMNEGIKKIKEFNKKIIDFIEKLREKAGKIKEVVKEDEVDEKIVQLIKKDYQKNLDKIILKKAEKKFDNGEELKLFVDEILEKYQNEFDKKKVLKTINYLIRERIRDNIWKLKKRVDNRKIDQVRDIKVKISVLPRTHGSAIFQRGDTQVLSIATLGAPSLEQLIESPEGEEAKRYIHHYNCLLYTS